MMTRTLNLMLLATTLATTLATGCLGDDPDHLDQGAVGLRPAKPELATVARLHDNLLRDILTQSGGTAETPSTFASPLCDVCTETVVHRVGSDAISLEVMTDAGTELCGISAARRIDGTVQILTDSCGARE